MAKYTEQDKLNEEVAKLQLEVTHLKRPWMHPTNSLSAVTTLIAVVALLIQFATNDAAHDKAEIAAARAALEMETLARQRDSLSNEVARLDEEEGKLTAEQSNLVEQQRQMRETATKFAAILKPETTLKSLTTNETFYEFIRRAVFPVANTFSPTNFPTGKGMGSKVVVRLDTNGIGTVEIEASGPTLKKTPTFNVVVYDVSGKKVIEKQDIESYVAKTPAARAGRPGIPKVSAKVDIRFKPSTMREILLAYQVAIQ